MRRPSVTKALQGHRGMSGFPLATHPKDSSYAITSWCICRRGTDIMTSALSFCHNTSASSVKRPQLSILRFSPPVWGDSCKQARRWSGGEGIILIPGVCQAFYGCPVTYAVVWSGQTALHGTGRGGQSLQAGPSASAGDIYTAVS